MHDLECIGNYLVNQWFCTTSIIEGKIRREKQLEKTYQIDNVVVVSKSLYLDIIKDSHFLFSFFYKSPLKCFFYMSNSI